MKKIIVENSGNLPTISWEELKKNYEPNTLKKDKNRDVSDLKTSILTLGFIVPFFIWKEGKFITDGAGRFLVLEMLELEGYEIPDLPYVPIKAKNKKEAKRQTLVISSKYGMETRESIGEFILDMEEIDLGFVNLDGFDMEEIEWNPPQAKEIDIDEMKGETRMEHTCPKCGFEFSTTE